MKRLRHNDDDKDDDDDDVNKKDAEVVEIDTGEALTMLQRLEGRNSLVTMQDKLNKIRVLNKN